MKSERSNRKHGFEYCERFTKFSKQLKCYFNYGNTCVYSLNFWLQRIYLGPNVIKHAASIPWLKQPVQHCRRLFWKIESTSSIYMHYFRWCVFTGANMNKKYPLYDINRKYDNAFIHKVTRMYVFKKCHAFQPDMLYTFHLLHTTTFHCIACDSSLNPFTDLSHFNTQTVPHFTRVCHQTFTKIPYTLLTFLHLRISCDLDNNISNIPLQKVHCAPVITWSTPQSTSTKISKTRHRRWTVMTCYCAAVYHNLAIYTAGQLPHTHAT